MKARIFMLALAAAVLSLVSMAAAETALQYRYKDVNAPGAVETDTYAINNSNVIAGDYVDANFQQHAMLLKGTNLTSVDKSDCDPTPGTTGIQFFGINTAGDAVGWCTNTNGVVIAFKYHAGTGNVTNIKITGAQYVAAYGINDNGAIVGSYIDANGVQHGFFKKGTNFKTLDPPGVVGGAVAFGINNNNAITAYGFNSNGTYVSFITKDKGQTYKEFHAPDEGSIGTAIHHINNNYDVTATYFDVNNNRHGLVRHNGKYFVLDDPNDVNISTRGVGINDNLLVVGRYLRADGVEQGYKAIPK